MRFGVKAVIIAMTLALSCTAGLTVSTRAETIYIPLMATHRSKIGIAPGGYQPGDLDRLQAAWTYRWNNQWYTDTIPAWVDMLWSDRYLYMPIRSDVILGFNEPDRADQANMTPEQGAIAWRLILTLYPTRTLISPAPSQLHPEWLWQMVDEYQRLYYERPRFDGIAVHYYAGPDTPTFAQWMQARRTDEQLHGYDVPLWVTETGACGIDEVEAFREMAAFVEATDWIERAAWYKLRADYYDTRVCSTMIDERGELTPLGEMYRGNAWR